ncbi:MAG: hypothetical protein V2I45_09440, partial [Halieaceae bacterium]|nr:hypothetical protein [Halieaceae bacterium]
MTFNRWVNRKYWQALGNAQWVFAARSQHDAWFQLANHADTPIRRFTKVQGLAGDGLYWAARRGQSPLILG